MPFGIHLTLTRDGAGDRWAPVTPAERVPSLVDDDGLLLTSAAAPQLVAQARIEEVERELRAQIEVVVRTGLRPTHLDWHVLADGGRRDVLDLTVALALEHGLAARVWLKPGRQAARARGLPVVAGRRSDYTFLDSRVAREVLAEEGITYRLPAPTERLASLGHAQEWLLGRTQDELAALSPNHVHVVALRSGHFVQRLDGQPEVVIGAVRAVVQAARGHTELPSCARLFSGSGVRCRD